MKRRIVVRPAAESDLDEQAEYLAGHGNLETGIRFYNAAEETFVLLASQPEMGRAAEFRSSLLAGIRMLPLKGFPKHLVFYKPFENTIEIIRVVHGARDIESFFEE